jgi:hypothetical protein
MIKRARIMDNNPLSQTDSVLDSFEQASQPASQLVDKSASQEDVRVQSAELAEQISTGVETEPPINRESRKSRSQEAGKLTSREVGKSTSQEVDKLLVKKSTFQLSTEVLEQLDTFHLQLQLELGKANTPYKEVLVEEAIAQLLERASQNRPKLIATLQRRQQQRE